MSDGTYRTRWALVYRASSHFFFWVISLETC